MVLLDLYILCYKYLLGGGGGGDFSMLLICMLEWEGNSFNLFCFRCYQGNRILSQI